MYSVACMFYPPIKCNLKLCQGAGQVNDCCHHAAAEGPTSGYKQSTQVITVHPPHTHRFLALFFICFYRARRSPPGVKLHSKVTGDGCPRENVSKNGTDWANTFFHLTRSIQSDSPDTDFLCSVRPPPTQENLFIPVAHDLSA